MGDRARESGSGPSEPLDRRFEAVVLVGARWDTSPEVRAAIASLLDTAMHVTLVPDDPHAALLALWQQGISPDSVLLVIDGPGADGDPPDDRPLPAGPTVVRVDQPRRLDEHRTVHVSGGHDLLVEVLADQHGRRARGDLPVPPTAPGWVLALEGFDPEQERVRAALLTVADGRIGATGAPLVAHPSAPPLVVHAGVYDGGDGIDTHLLEGPVPTQLSGDVGDGAGLRRVLDLRAGVLHQELTTRRGSMRSVRFASLVRPGLLVQRVEATPPHGALPPGLLDPPPGEHAASAVEGTTEWVQVEGSPGGLTAAARHAPHHGPDAPVRTQLTAYAGDEQAAPPPERAVDELPDDHPATFDRLLGEHRAEWARRWAHADVVVEGDDELQQAVRFALFHLVGVAASTGEAAVGARGLTGAGYRGHVFWDADAFTLPFLAATHPTAARAMLEYRVRRLPAAMEAARELGRHGARFPWESARTGRDVTPPSARDRSGRLVPIRTGGLEDHIVADVAWAARCYVDWTGDDAFARGAGLPLFVETARYWASRVRLDPDGLAHIYGVIGPDEYHEPVDDNAFTNVMARWNLRQAAALTGDGPDGPGVGAVSAEERCRWLDLADALVDGYDPDTGLYEQCAGFFRLEPLIVAEVAPRRPIAADLLLGAARVRAAQVIKQADVLMLHHLVPEEVEPGTLEPNLRFYEPRCAHGSSLSPAIHAGLFARARDFERALAAVRIASRIDLDDLTGSTAAGLHIATMGGLWQAMVWGFAGMRPSGGCLGIDPLLPPGWTALEVNVRYRGSRVSVRREGPDLLVRADPGAPVRIDGASYDVGSTGLSFTRRRRTWEVNR